MSAVDPAVEQAAQVERETAEQAAQRIYNHGGYHGSVAATEDAMRAFVHGATWAFAEANLLATTQGAGDGRWEYAVDYAQQQGRGWVNGWRTARDLDNARDLAGTLVDGKIMRRRPAGPWEPVDQQAVTEP